VRDERVHALAVRPYRALRRAAAVLIHGQRSRRSGS
jgi:hypothetical protein